jgi:LysM repeat protein
MSKSPPKRSSAPARVLAAAAVLCGFVVVVVVIANSLGGGGDGGSGSSGGGSQAAKHGSSGAKRHTPKTYVVENGDTLTSIAHRTGVTVVRIRELNPGIDPQILISGETLKLR